MKRNIGLILITVSILVFLINKVSLIIPTFLGELYCGERYMQAVNGIVGDVSCGFNVDMYLFIFLFIILLIGVAVVITTRRTKVENSKL